MIENADESPERPKPDHEAIEAILAADPNCEKDDSPDDPDGEVTVTLLVPQAAERLKRQQEKRSDR